jgi:hypothetical protein
MSDPQAGSSIIHVCGRYRLSRLDRATLDLYTQSDLDEMQEAHGAYITEIGIATGTVQ